MIKLKESSVRVFKGTHYSDGWLEMALGWPNYKGKTGLKVFEEHDIKIVHNGESADVGFSKNGNLVRNVKRNKCVLWKGEPPIYNVFFGLNLCNPNFLKSFLGVMSYYELDGLDQVHVNGPQNGFSFIDKYFSNKKNKLLCTILRNKRIATELNFMLLPHYRKYSLMPFRETLDNQFAETLGSELYASYGRGWNPKCFRGGISKWDEKYRIFGEHKFCFSPENSRFKGYVTDKVFNSMCCGSVPIYAGAPDVDKYLPKYTYINTDEYTSEELISYIKNMPFSTYQKYRVAMKKFVTTEQSDMYSSYHFAEHICNIIKDKLC